MNNISNHRGQEKSSDTSSKNDTLYQVNGIAYLEGNLKISHLRILMAILKQLQTPIQFAIARQLKKLKIPPAFLPKQIENGNEELIRVIRIPTKEFHLQTNRSRLSTYLDELKETRCIFPSNDIKYTSGIPVKHKFHGLIAGYCLAPYDTVVEIYLKEEMVGRLLLIEEGYFSITLSSALSLTNKYTVRIYWLICSWRTKGGFSIMIADLKRILCLGPGYARLDNLVDKIIRPASEELRARFPIWFNYKIYDRDDVKRIVFKIKIGMTEEERNRRLMKEVYGIRNMLEEIGVLPNTINYILKRLEIEDLSPFKHKIISLVQYVTKKKSIKNADQYIRTSMEKWFDDWSERYLDVSE